VDAEEFFEPHPQSSQLQYLLQSEATSLIISAFFFILASFLRIFIADNMNSAKCAK
jgi:hypothetical protein